MTADQLEQVADLVVKPLTATVRAEMQASEQRLLSGIQDVASKLGNHIEASTRLLEQHNQQIDGIQGRVNRLEQRQQVRSAVTKLWWSIAGAGWAVVSGAAAIGLERLVRGH